MSEFGQGLIAKVREVAAAKPDFQYRGQCKYVVDGKPSCLVGQALWRLNFIDEDFEMDSANTDGMLGVLDRLALAVDAPELNWLIDVQNAQDTWATWGDAVKRGDNPPPDDEDDFLGDPDLPDGPAYT